MTDWRKYIIAFLITLGIFATAIYTSNRLNAKKLSDLQAIQSRVSVDILSSEVQYELLAEASCESVGDSVLSEELNNLGAKLSYAETEIQLDEEEILALKKSYSLLEIKDFLLMNKLSVRCKTKPVFILYFYSNKDGACDDCKKEGAVLTYLHETYPGLRVYSFDHDLDLSAVKTLRGLYKIQGDKLPALVLNGKSYAGFKTIEDIEKMVPELKALRRKDDTATPTQKDVRE